ncbi:hypothetical protein [Pseudomonas protegens]|uniref:hypothetical protein n=1 Tax=Pseudomonas protegens TaxID=380021 RepID=UPI00177C5155|nr:hypothetical protein [Pseudomonas protegens]
MSAVETVDDQAGAQQELPFAMVYGQAVMEMPLDLYIPRMPWKSFSKPSKARWTCCCT